MSCFNIGVAKIHEDNLVDLQSHNCRGQPNIRNQDSKSFSKNRTSNNKLIFGVPKVANHIRQKTSIEQIVKTKNGLKKRKPTKRAVRAIEVVFRITASHFFNFDNQSQIDRFETLRMSNDKERKIIEKCWQDRLNTQKVEQIEKLISDYVKQKFGDNLVQLVAHMDEKGPHWHAVWTPITKDGRLSAKEMYTREWLNTMLKECEAIFNPIGLKKDKDPLGPAEHIANKTYTSAPTEPATVTQKFSIRKQLKLEDCIEQQSGIFSKKEIQKKSIAEILDHSKGIENDYIKVINHYKSFYDKNYDKIRRTDAVQEENLKLRKENKRLTKSGEVMYKKLTEEQVKNARSIDCDEVMQSLGYTGKREGSTYRYKNDAINLVITEGQKFTENKSMENGGGAIDLLVKVFKYKFKEAVTFLSTNFGTDKVVKVIPQKDKDILLKEKIEEEVKKLPIPEEKKQNIDSVKTYLTKERNISEEIVNNLVSQKLLYADKNRNCVFLNSKNTYAFLRGTYKEKRFVGTRGEQDFIEYKVGNSKDVYLFESCIEALSFQTMYPNLEGRYIVTNGSAMINKVKELDIDKNSLVYCCFNNDTQGQKFCDKITKDLSSYSVESLTPVTKDWNEDLKNGNTVTKLADRNSKTASRTRAEAKTI